MRADRLRRGWPWLRRVVSPLVLVVAALLLWHQLQALRLGDVSLAIRALPVRALAACLAATVASFACLAAMECVAVRDVLRLPVPAAVAARVGAVSHALSNTLGFPAVTAGYARYRGYRHHAPTAIGITQILAVVGGAVVAGALLLAAVALLAQQVAGRGASAAALLLPCIVLALLDSWSGSRARSARCRRRVAIAQLGALSLLETTVAVVALHALIPPEAGVGFAQFVLLFLGASAAGVISQSPGGVGVFEAAMLVALPAVPAASLLVSLLAFRVVYNLMPFAVASLAVLVEQRRKDGCVDQLEGG